MDGSNGMKSRFQDGREKKSWVTWVHVTCALIKTNPRSALKAGGNYVSNYIKISKLAPHAFGVQVPSCREML